MPSQKSTKMEKWIDIKSYEGRYQVSDLGRVRSLVCRNGRKSEKSYCNILKPSKNNSTGYLNVILYDGKGHGKRFSVHRLVAVAFCGLRDDQIVNHIDGDKTNNSCCNLEACTYSHNALHAISSGLRREHGGGHVPKKVRLLRDGHVVSVYDSIKEMCRQNYLQSSNVWAVLHGKAKHHKGFTFELV